MLAYAALLYGPGRRRRQPGKEVADVVGVMARAGITRLVARLEPMGVVKG